MELHELTVAAAAELIREGEVSPVDLVEALLRRIDELDPDLQAWVTVDREGALTEARRREQEMKGGETAPLHGVPVAVKDIFHTRGLPTTCGVSFLDNSVSTYDATAVARLRSAGAIILGKTMTTPFAHFDPSPTRNPWNRERTPGGSSSGSAAAVAAGMVPAALGTQSGGSIVRPAAFCGVVGLKPSYGRISRYGVMPCSWSLDHVGVLTRRAEDAALLLRVLAGRDPLDPTSFDKPAIGRCKPLPESVNTPRLGLELASLSRASSEVANHLAQVVTRMKHAGAEIREVCLPVPLEVLLAIRSTIEQVEAAAIHSSTFVRHARDYPFHIRNDVEVGQLIPAGFYLHALRLRRTLRPQIEKVFDGLDGLVTPAVSTVAPDRSTTGDVSLQATWSLFGMPSISLPSGLSKDGLPYGIQLVAPRFMEDVLLRTAAWCEKSLGTIG